MISKIKNLFSSKKQDTKSNDFVSRARDLLIGHEGLKLHPYTCPAGKLTIGVGRNIEDNGISREEALMLLDNDIASCTEDLRTLFGNNFDNFPKNIQLVLLDMRFNLGLPRFKRFKRLIKAVRRKDWESMILEMRDSKWCHQLPSRCFEDVELVREVIHGQK